MVFGGEGLDVEDDMRRYCTEAEALAGHAEMLADLRAKIEATSGGEPT